jgi:hypothetical protein
MKKLTLIILLFFICICTSSCKQDENTDIIYEKEKIVEDRYEIGYNDGYSDCEMEHENDYSNGYNDGYQDGATYTCLFFGDVDRAIKSAYKGSSWACFISAYDQYIKDIYDDDETKSSLFWALASIKSKEGLTYEERDLLISTFGEDIFTRNDIDISVN